MGTQSKRKSKMPLKCLKFKSKREEKEVWKNFINIYDAATKSGYTATAIYNWIRNKKIEAWQYRGIIVISRESKIPPGSLIGKRKNLMGMEFPK